MRHTVGTDATFDFETRGFGLYRVELEAGKRYELAMGGGASARLINGEGNTLSDQSLDFDGTRYLYLVPVRSGSYRFTMRPFAPRGIGG